MGSGGEETECIMGNTESGGQVLKNFSRFYTARKKRVMVFSFF